MRRLLPLGLPCLVFVLLCLGGVTTSSLGALRATSHPVAHQIGTPETIRSDEYMTESAITLGWITSGGHDVSDPLSVPPNFFAQLPSGPVSSITFFDGTLLRLGPWLPDAWLFAAKWWLPTLLLVLGLPTWFRQLTDSRRWGWVATALVFFAPANQWWSGRPVNTLGFMFAAAALMIDAQQQWTRRRRWLAALEIVAAAVLIARFPSYYQPFAIVLGFPVLISTVLFLLRQPAPWAAKAWSIGGTGALAAALTAGTMLENLTAIRAGLGTVYPGQRISTGVAQPFGKVFGATVLAPLQHVQSSLVGTNATEASSAFVVLLLVALLLRATSRWNGGPGTGACWWTWVAATLGWLSWCTLDYGRLGAHLPLLDLVPAVRSANVCGFLAIVAFCLAVAYVERSRWPVAVAAGSLVTVVSLAAGLSWRAHGMTGLGLPGIAVSSVVAGVVVGAAVRWPERGTPLVALGVAAACLTVLVNPVVAGLGDLRGTVAADTMIAAGRTARADHTFWASNDLRFDALMFATGTPALSSRQQIGPDDAAWAALDPGAAHRGFWNRGGSYIRFRWNRSPTIAWSNPTQDQIVMTTSPCTVARLEPRLTHVVSTKPLDLPCLSLERVVPWDGMTQLIYLVHA